MRVDRDIAEIDIWRAAKRLVDQHGEDAPLVAAQRADEMLARGDVEGQAVAAALPLRPLGSTYDRTA